MLPCETDQPTRTNHHFNTERTNMNVTDQGRISPASPIPLPLNIVNRAVRRNHQTDSRQNNQQQLNQPPQKAPTQLSEHGHDLTEIEPLAKHSGESVNTFFNGLFTTIIAISTLGTSITFSYVLSNQSVTPSSTARFDANQVQLFLSLSWLCFLLTLAFASLGSTLLTFFKKHWIRDWDGVHGKTSQWTVQMYAVLASSVMGALILTAFVLMCLVVVAYQPVVGWISLGFTGMFGLVIVVSVCNQVPWPWADNTPEADKESFA